MDWEKQGRRTAKERVHCWLVDVFYHYIPLVVYTLTDEDDTLHHVPVLQPEEGFS